MSRNSTRVGFKGNTVPCDSLEEKVNRTSEVGVPTTPEEEEPDCIVINVATMMSLLIDKVFNVMEFKE